jgi:hypothetical protein
MNIRLTKDDFDYCNGCQRFGFEGGIPICVSFESVDGEIKQVKKDCINKQIYEKLRVYEQKYE